MREPSDARNALALLTLAILLVSGLSLAASSAHAATGVVTRTQSGMVASDSLISGDTSRWTFGNSGPLLGTYSSSEDSQGLHIGSQSTVMLVDWSYNSASSPGTAASLFHATVSLPYTSVLDGRVNTGLYVEDQNGNFVECGAVADQTGNYWIVASGNIMGSTILYNSGLNQPASQDCTIITNGSSYLKVYLGGNLVFSSSSLALNLLTPLHAYLELITSSASSMHIGTFVNYYATLSEAVTVTNAPPGGTAQIVDASNMVLATAAVDSTGTASLLAGMYALPLNANVNVYDSSNSLIGSTPTLTTIWGGDTLTVGGGTTSSSSTTTSSITSSTSTSTTSTTTTASTTTTSTTSTVLGGITVYAHRIPATYWDPCFATTCSAGTGPGAGMYIALLDSGGNLLQSGYADENGLTFSGLNPSTTYYVYPADCNGCHGSAHNVVFDHWGDGSAVRPRATAVGSSLDAWYSCTNLCQ